MNEKELEELAAKKRKEVYDVLKNKKSVQYNSFLTACENKPKEEIIYDVNVYKEIFSVEDEIAEEVFSAVTRNKIYDLVKNNADKGKPSLEKKSPKKGSPSVEKRKNFVNVPFFIILVIAIILLITVVSKNSVTNDLQKSNQLLIEEKENLQNSYQMVKEENGELKGKNDQLKKENDQLKEENDQLQKKVTHWQRYSGVYK